MERKAQCIICKCGSVIAACLVPHCFDDKDWMKMLEDIQDLVIELKLKTAMILNWQAVFVKLSPLKTKLIYSAQKFKHIPQHHTDNYSYYAGDN